MAPAATQNGSAATGGVEPKACSTNGLHKAELVSQVGMQCDIKNLYQKEDDRGMVTWMDRYPDGLDEAAENEITAQYAILVRNKKSYDSRKKLEIDSIVVQSPLLKKALEKVLEGYPSITPTLKRLVFEAPFKPFVHRWSEFTAALTEQEDDGSTQHLELLHSTLTAELKDTIAERNDFIENKVITYGHLWTIFQPGATVYTEEWGQHCGTKFSRGDYTDHPKYGPCYSVHSQKVDWDGDRFGYANSHHLIPSFRGTMPISALEAFPLEFHPEEKKIRAQLVKRGKTFEAYQGYHYKAYKSFAIGKNMCGNDIKVTVDSRIIIDTFAYSKFNPNGIEHLASLTIKSKAAIQTSNDPLELNNYKSEGYDNNYTMIDQTHIDKKPTSLTDDQLTHCTPLLRGYALKIKRWLSFFVDSISPITWNSSAFNNLVLPPSQKELILAFTSAQTKYKDTFDDVISGKGKGIIMLLSGGPGIGKTLTAESIAEDMRVPLYMMSAGDLGIKSHEVERSLTTILEMVAKWNAVLLLDECDVFLEERSAHDLERNKIVSIFLRTLEYYEGILFLTTNRVKNMDPAFQSRIHISMEYPSLDKAARTQVWRNFLDRGIEHELIEEEVDRLAQVDINGRQIKNVLKTSQLLSQHKQEPLRYQHIKTVLDVEQKQPALAKA